MLLSSRSSLGIPRDQPESSAIARTNCACNVCLKRYLQWNSPSLSSLRMGMSSVTWLLCWKVGWWHGPVPRSLAFKPQRHQNINGSTLIAQVPNASLAIVAGGLLDHGPNVSIPSCQYCQNNQLSVFPLNDSPFFFFTGTPTFVTRTRLSDRLDLLILLTLAELAALKLDQASVLFEHVSRIYFPLSLSPTTLTCWDLVGLRSNERVGICQASNRPLLNQCQPAVTSSDTSVR